jgi:peptidyl-prolyl cis-trans isomerase C
MSCLSASDNVTHPPRTRRGTTPSGVLALTLFGLFLSDPARAADISAPASPSSWSSAAYQIPAVVADPAMTLATMANHLEQQPDFVVLRFETLPITRHDVAGVIRAMPLGMANLSFDDVYHRALDVSVRQKAMVMRARLENLDKDPVVIHQSDIAVEHVLADAWLRRRADAAVTDQALHERYDRDIAGKPGPDRVRARVILVATEAEAKTLIEQLRLGADFADLARLRSQDPTSASGGDLGYVTRDTISPDVAAAMFSLTPGQTTPYPVASLLGYYIIRAEGRSNGETPTFDEARATLESDIRADAIREAIGSLLSNVQFAFPSKPGEEAPAPAKP